MFRLSPVGAGSAGMTQRNAMIHNNSTLIFSVKAGRQKLSLDSHKRDWT
jgi:hypothetical protein